MARNRMPKQGTKRKRHPSNSSSHKRTGPTPITLRNRKKLKGNTTSSSCSSEQKIGKELCMSVVDWWSAGVVLICLFEVVGLFRFVFVVVHVMLFVSECFVFVVEYALWYRISIYLKREYYICLLFVPPISDVMEYQGRGTIRENNRKPQ